MQSVESNKLQLVNSFSRGLMNIAKVISPVMAGIIMAFWPKDILYATRIVLIIDVLSFVGCAVLFMFLNIDVDKYHSRNSDAKFLQEYRTGFLAIKQNKSIQDLYFFLFLVAVIGTFPFLIKVPYVMDTLKGSTIVLGAVNSAVALGAILGSFLLIVLRMKTKLVSVFVCRFFQGVMYVGLALINTISPVIILYFVISGVASFSQVVEDTYQQMNIEREVLGKVMSSFITVHSLLVLISLQIAKYINKVASNNAIMLYSGIGFIIVSMIFMLKYCFRRKKLMTLPR